MSGRFNGFVKSARFYRDGLKSAGFRAFARAGVSAYSAHHGKLAETVGPASGS